MLRDLKTIRRQERELEAVKELQETHKYMRDRDLKQLYLFNIHKDTLSLYEQILKFAGHRENALVLKAGVTKRTFWNKKPKMMIITYNDTTQLILYTRKAKEGEEFYQNEQNL